MIDLHAHVLPGLDDGVRSLEEAVELAREAVAGGITAMAATPHVRDDYPTTPEQMESGVAELRTRLAEEGVPLALLHGAEVSIDRAGLLDRDTLRRLTIAQSDRYLLLEFPYVGWPITLEAAVERLRERGVTAILAHPERNPQVQERPERLEAAVDAGALVQLTAASVLGQLGRTTRRTSERLLRLNLVHLLASDSHGPGGRGTLSAAAAELGDAAFARRLCHDVPAAICAGKDVPASPHRRGPRWGRRRQATL